MSRDEHRRRIPTSEEVERQSGLVPSASSVTDGRRGLFGFLRVGRIRVSGDVAARKYVPPDPRHARPATETATAQSEDLPSVVLPTNSVAETSGESASRYNAEAAAQASSVQPAPLVPRPIRIDPSVRERRGLGPADSQP